MAPYRQWVFSFPWRIRVALAADTRLLSQVLGVCLRKVFAFQRRKARRLGISAPQTLAVCFVQRFGSLLSLNPHGHAVVPDGVFARDPSGGVRFAPLPAPTDDELQAVALAIVKGILRLLARAAERARDEDDVAMMQALAEAAQVTSAAARNHRDHLDGTRRPARPAALIRTDLGLFSIHADTDVAAHDRAGLERLVRYGARPAFPHKRLSTTPSGKVCYRLRKAYYTGQTEVVLEPVAFLRRLAALVPPRGQHQVRYYGALAARSQHRDHVVGWGLDGAVVPEARAGDDTEAPPRSRYRQAWAQLLARVFEHQVLLCPRCQGPRTIIAAFTDKAVAATILEHLGLPTDLPVMQGARAPPQLEMLDRFEHAPG